MSTVSTDLLSEVDRYRATHYGMPIGGDRDDRESSIIPGWVHDAASWAFDIKRGGSLLLIIAFLGLPFFGPIFGPLVRIVVRRR